MLRYLHRNDAADAPETDAANHERETEMMTTTNTASKGKAFATRTDGNVYHVRYDRSRAMDANVSGRYLVGLVESGYEVVIAAGQFGGREVGTLVNGEVKWAKA